MTVRIRDDKEWTEAKKMEREALVKRFQNPANVATKEIVAGYTKEGGEVVLTTASVEGREALERMQEWAANTYPSAVVLRQTFPVAAHGACLRKINEED